MPKAKNKSKFEVHSIIWAKRYIKNKNPKVAFRYFSFLSLLPMLQSKHRVWRFSKTVLPHLEKGRMWSIWRTTPTFIDGLLPQKTHLKLSLFKTFNLNLKEISLLSFLSNSNFVTFSLIFSFCGGVSMITLHPISWLRGLRSQRAEVNEPTPKASSLIWNLSSLLTSVISYSNGLMSNKLQFFFNFCVCSKIYRATWSADTCPAVPQ